MMSQSSPVVRVRCSLALLLLASILGACAASASEVKEFALDNGLKLIVKPDHRAPVVVSQVWYRVGSSYERPGITGVSHMLEHMMFKGSERLQPGEFSRIIADNGGRENAFTGRDFTAYYQHLEKSRLAISFELEAERMGHLQLSAEALQTERQVVLEERRLRTDDNPQALTHEHFLATAFLQSPYRHPIIGWQNDIKSYRLESLEQWYQRWYAPNNAVVVVVGDVDPQAVRTLAQRYFGPLKPAPAATIASVQESAQFGPKRIEVRRPATVSYLLMGYKVPSLATAARWEAYALEVLAELLDGDESARLPRRLVRGQSLAASVSVSYDLYDRLGTLFEFAAIPNPNTSIDVLESALREEVARIQREPVSPRELERVKARAVAEEVYARDSLFYQAMKLGRVETVGIGWQEAEMFMERVNAITAAQVQEVAREYLVNENLTVALLRPQRLTGSAGEAGDAL
jgi:zinc protease